MANRTVDIFFIIAGFLITEQLIKIKQFDLKEYFFKRSVRLLPLYFAVIAFVYFMPNFSYIENSRMRSYEYKSTVIDGSLYGFEDFAGKEVLIQIERSGKGKTLVIQILENGLTESIIIPREYDTVRASFKDGRALTIVLSETEEVWTLSKHPKFTESIFFFLIFVQNYAKIFTTNLNHLWFIAPLVHFYIFYGLLIYILFKLIKEGEQRRKVLLLLLGALIIGINIYKLNIPPESNITNNMTHLRADAIFFGCLLNILAQYFPTSDKKTYRHLIAAVLFIMGVSLISLLAFKFPASLIQTNLSKYALIYTLNYVGFSLMIASAYTNSLSTRLAFENPLIKWIGKHSYGIYIWHVPFINIFLMYRKYLVVYYPIAIAAYLILSVIIGACLEKILNRLASKIMSPNKLSYHR
jgi:peptidoglycan/LPS O-acetylase OafA/YrhL